jgi:hypothetical protein
MSHPVVTVRAMPKNPRAASLTVRMSPQLKEGLTESARAAGCSLNAFAVQVLAAAAGHQARFRGTAQTGPSAEERAGELRAMARNRTGYPFDWKERDRHSTARHAFTQHAMTLVGRERAVRATLLIDVRCPWHFVEWYELKGPVWPEGLEPARLRAAG